MDKRTFLNTLLGAAMALGMTMGAAHAEDALARVKKAGVLKVGTETAFAPFDFIDAGKHAGLNVDLFAEIGKEIGRQDRLGGAALGRRAAGPRGAASSTWSPAPRPSPRRAWSATASRRRSPRRRSRILKKAGDDTHRQAEDIAGKAIGRRQGDRPARPAPGLRRRRSRARSRSRNISASTRPMPTSPPAASSRSRTRCPTSPSWPSSAPTPSRWCSRLSASRPISATSAARTPTMPRLMDAIDAAILKMKADGRLATHAEEVVRRQPSTRPTR